MPESLTPLEQRLKKRQEEANQADRNALTNYEQTLTEHLQAVKATMQNDLKRQNEVLQSEIFKLVLVPMVCVILLALLAGFGIWAWWQIQSPYEVKTFTNQSGNPVQMRVLKEVYPNNCTVNNEQRACKPLER